MCIRDRCRSLRFPETDQSPRCSEGRLVHQAAKHAILQAPEDEVEGCDHGLCSPALDREDAEVRDQPLEPQMAKNSSHSVYRRAVALNHELSLQLAPISV